jgi:glycosyltransferase involved in cell wall biosynthesis
VASILWEVLLVDNNSTDATKKAAVTEWNRSNPPVPLRVVHESQRGLSHARRAGLAVAKYDLICFIDDDNWVCPEWVQTCIEIMSSRPEFGMCGGPSVAAFEATPPFWFEKFKMSFGVGPQSSQVGDVTGKGIFLRGAGLVLRKAAYERLFAAGFRQLLVGREGTALSSGEDTELCMALSLAGWRTWYDDRLSLQHYMPAGRLQWSYLRRLHRGFGAAKVALRPYWEHLDPQKHPRLRGLKAMCWWQAGGQAKGILQQHWRDLFRLRHSHEGDSQIIALEEKLGGLTEIINRRKQDVHALDWFRRLNTRTKIFR